MKRQEGSVNACYLEKETRLTMVVHSRTPNSGVQKRQNYEDKTQTRSYRGLPKGKGELYKALNYSGSEMFLHYAGMVGTCSLHLSKPTRCPVL